MVRTLASNSLSHFGSKKVMSKFSQLYKAFRSNIGADLGKLENNRTGRNEFVANKLISDNLSI